jgi:sugar lactone lactonase YvrE
VAEVHGSRLTAYDIGQEGDLANRRMWATAGDDHPDGICIDAERAVWYADVGNRHCVRMREGGEILATVDLDRGAFACTLSRDDKPQLYVVGQQFGGPETAEPTGQVVVFPAPAPALASRRRPSRRPSHRAEGSACETRIDLRRVVRRRRLTRRRWFG